MLHAMAPRHPGALPRHRASFPADAGLSRRDRVAAWGLNLVTLRAPEPSPGLWQTEHRGVLREAQGRASLWRPGGHDVWFTGLRREQSPSRAGLQEVEPFRLPNGQVLRKISPLAGWTDERRLGLRENARHSAVAALRSRLHERRLRAVHVAAARHVERAVRTLAGQEARVRDSHPGGTLRGDFAWFL